MSLVTKTCYTGTHLLFQQLVEIVSIVIKVFSDDHRTAQMRKMLKRICIDKAYQHSSCVIYQPREAEQLLYILSVLVLFLR